MTRDFSVTAIKEVYVCEVNILLKRLSRKSGINLDTPLSLMGDSAHEIIEKQPVSIVCNGSVHTKKSKNLRADINFGGEVITIHGSPDGIIYDEHNNPVFPVENKFRKNINYVGKIHACDHVQASSYCWLLNKNNQPVKKYALVTSTFGCEDCPEYTSYIKAFLEGKDRWECECNISPAEKYKLIARTFDFDNRKTKGYIRNAMGVLLGYRKAKPTENEALCRNCDVKDSCGA